jgi:hypothetical protein
VCCIFQNRDVAIAKGTSEADNMEMNAPDLLRRVLRLFGLLLAVDLALNTTNAAQDAGIVSTADVTIGITGGRCGPVRGLMCVLRSAKCRISACRFGNHEGQRLEHLMSNVIECIPIEYRA